MPKDKSRHPPLHGVAFACMENGPQTPNLLQSLSLSTFLQPRERSESSLECTVYLYIVILLVIYWYNRCSHRYYKNGEPQRLGKRIAFFYYKRVLDLSLFHLRLFSY